MRSVIVWNSSCDESPLRFDMPKREVRGFMATMKSSCLRIEVWSESGSFIESWGEVL